MVGPIVVVVPWSSGLGVWVVRLKLRQVGEKPSPIANSPISGSVFLRISAFGIRVLRGSPLRPDACTDAWTLEFRDAAGGIFLPHCHELSDMNSEPGSSQFSVFDVRASAHPGTAPARAWHALGTAKTSIKRALARCHTHFHPPPGK